MRKIIFSLVCLGIFSVPFNSSAAVTVKNSVKKEANNLKPKKKKKKHGGGCEAYGRFGQEVKR